MADSLNEWQVCKIRNFSTLCYWPFKGGGPRAVLILCCFAVYSTRRFMFSLALFFVLVLFSVILTLWSHYLGKRELCWPLIVTLPIFHTCELFARIQRVKNSHEFVTDFQRICHTRVTYTFYTSFIGGMNANSSHCSKYPFKSCLSVTYEFFSRVFHNLFNNFVNRKLKHVILYAYSGMFEFPRQVLELIMYVGRGSPPRPSVGSGMDE